MAVGNSVALVGNVTRDPELRFTPSGQAVAAFGLAVNRRWQNKQTQEWEEAVSFFDVTAWSQLAENIGAAARVMANFGLSDLRLVNPRDGWPQERA